MEVLHRGATLEVTNTPSPILFTTTQVSTQNSTGVAFYTVASLCERVRGERV